MIVRHIITIAVIAILVNSCVTQQKAVNQPTNAADESTFVYVLNCRYYTRNELTRLGLPEHDSMLLSNHPGFEPWADSCAYIAQNSFPRYIGGALDKKIQQLLKVDTTGRFDTTTATAVKKLLSFKHNKKLSKGDVYGLFEFPNGPILTKGMYSYLNRLLRL